MNSLACRLSRPGRGRLLPLVLSTAAVLATLTAAIAESPPTAEAQQEYARRCQAKLRGMTASQDLSDSQAARISYFLQDQASMIELFGKHGLLSESQLSAKLRSIDEITRTGILDVLTRDQRAIWWTWDLKLDAAILKKPEPRLRLLPGR